MEHFFVNLSSNMVLQLLWWWSNISDFLKLPWQDVLFVEITFQLFSNILCVELLPSPFKFSNRFECAILELMFPPISGLDVTPFWSNIDEPTWCVQWILGKPQVIVERETRQNKWNGIPWFCLDRCFKNSPPCNENSERIFNRQSRSRMPIVIHLSRFWLVARIRPHQPRF